MQRPTGATEYVFNDIEIKLVARNAQKIALLKQRIEQRLEQIVSVDPSPHVEPLIDHFRFGGYEVKKVRVPYEFQRCGNLMLRIKKVEPWFGEGAGNQGR